ncbi:aldose 1-epimerase [Polaribacter marinivivus]|uniref:aldose 1-epimerase n=1 Tax=Polaribacter marinivivus TaxID=1524260 RepID=UPI003D34DDD7
MFKIYQQNENNKEYIILESNNKQSYASICLDEGARVNDLMLNGNSIIKEQPNFDYRDSYASSILFPFASRLEKGVYTFQNNTYQLHKNDKGINALHGLVYNKKFELLDVKEHQDKCIATFKYYENNPPKGFPYNYELLVSYTLYKGDFQITLLVNNLDSAAFPFTIGWHPYFNCNDFSKAYLHFKSSKKIVFDNNLITEAIKDFIINKKFYLENKQLDDCFILNEQGVDFITSEYHIKITSDALENYLQLYTPKNKPIIAIEPMTGISNSLNNEIGLQVLEPNKTYSVNFRIQLI